jgi:hypothetical protein
MMKIRLSLLVFVMLIAGSSAMSQATGGISVGKGSHPVVKNKPDPEWPRSIKKKSSLTIILRCVFASDATVKNIRFVETKPNSPDDYSAAEVNDLVQRAIDAAQKIKFTPAMKDGKPVSMWMELQYNFGPPSNNSSNSSDKKSDKPQ